MKPLLLAAALLVAAPAQALTLRDFLDAVRTPLPPPPQPYYGPQPPPIYQPQPFQQPYNPYGRRPIPPDVIQQTCVNMQQQANWRGMSAHPRNVDQEEMRSVDYLFGQFGWSYRDFWREAKRSGIYPCTVIW